MRKIECKCKKKYVLTDDYSFRPRFVTSWIREIGDKFRVEENHHSEHCVGYVTKRDKEGNTIGYKFVSLDMFDLDNEETLQLLRLI